MTEYVPPSADVAEKIRRAEAELEAHRHRLENADTEELRRILRDSSQPSLVRQIALGQLIQRLRRSGELSEILPDLLEVLIDDPHRDIVTTVLQYCPLTDDRVVGKVRRLLDSDDGRIMAAAAIALAEIKDESVYSTLLDWFNGDSEGPRNLAIEGLQTLQTKQSRSVLEAAYARGGRNQQDRIVIAIALLRLGDKRGLSLLEDVARRAIGRGSVTAATWIYAEHERARGLELMLNILDQGDIEAKRAMVNQIWNFVRIPRAFEAEGIHEARTWVEGQLKS